MLAVPRWASKVMLCWMGSIVADLSASIAFYRRLGVEIPDAGVWRTPTGGHHASAADQSADQATISISTPPHSLKFGTSAGRVELT